jgi:chromosomal replication initiator protein
MTINEKEDVRLLKSTKEIWNEARKLLSKKLQTPSFESWIRPAHLLEYEQGSAVIGVTNDFMRGMIANNYIETISQAIGEITREAVSVRVLVDSSLKNEDYTATIASITPSAPASPVASFSTAGQPNSFNQYNELDASNQEAIFDSSSPSNIIRQPLNPVFQPGYQGQALFPRPPAEVLASKSNLNPKYIFQTFVVGSHNRFSHSAAQAVAQRPGQAYNPLFIYGGVGLGKTHLMHAIGHEILKTSPNAAVRYISCEKFTNELINSIRDDRMIDFRKRYRQIDVLLVDDIQFIQGKESTQEEFFHTFNALRDSGKQIILSSDRPPKALAKLEERLRSRFEWGLIADIQAPDFETRLAILHKKCAMEGMKFQSEILEYIASIFTTNIRELEGALIRSQAYSNMTGEPLTMGTISSLLQPSSPTKTKVKITIEKIMETVASHYRVEPSELRSAKRSQDLTLPRHIAMYLAHELIKMSFPRVGEAFGNRKHTSALYAHGRIKEAMTKDPSISQAVRQITAILGD